MSGWAWGKRRTSERADKGCQGLTFAVDINMLNDERNKITAFLQTEQTKERKIEAVDMGMFSFVKRTSREVENMDVADK